MGSLIGSSHWLGATTFFRSFFKVWTVMAIFSLVKEVFRNEDGQGMVEYALVIALVAIVASVALKSLGSTASNTLSKAASSLA
jgi:pilus assembly protein Flp/PilA